MSLNNADLIALERQHVMAGEVDGGCVWCAEDWPCMTSRLVADLRASRLDSAEWEKMYERAERLCACCADTLERVDP